MTRVPWKTLLRHAPTIVDAARSFYDPARNTASDARPAARAVDGIDRLRLRVEVLEQRDAQQAAVLADLAKHAQELAGALEALRARMRLAVVGAAVAAVLSVLTVAFVLWTRR